MILLLLFLFQFSHTMENSLEKSFILFQYQWNKGIYDHVLVDRILDELDKPTKLPDYLKKISHKIEYSSNLTQLPHIPEKKLPSPHIDLKKSSQQEKLTSKHPFSPKINGFRSCIFCQKLFITLKHITYSHQKELNSWIDKNKYNENILTSLDFYSYWKYEVIGTTYQLFRCKLCKSNAYICMDYDTINSHLKHVHLGR